MNIIAMNRAAAIYGILMLVVLVGGCGRPSGPERFDVSGTVTFAGRPVPTGVVGFAPDTKLGNNGPGTSVLIKDGRYQTQSGKGTVGGPHIVTIYGYDGKHTSGGPYGASIFPTYRTKIDLPHETTTHDFGIARK